MSLRKSKKILKLRKGVYRLARKAADMLRPAAVTDIAALMTLPSSQIAASVPPSVPASLPQIQQIREECDRHGGWLKWMDELEPFRRAYEKYLNATTVVGGQHIEDHHAHGYFAPLDWKGLGFGRQMRTPAEQIIDLAEQFYRRNVRFIYVALPCKTAILPEPFVPESVIPEDGILIPQWRKVLLEVMQAGVEVVDMFPVYRRHRNEILYSEHHFVSPHANKLAAFETAKLLGNERGKKDFPLEEYEFEYKFPWFTEPKRWTVEGVKGAKKSTESNIVVFGNCNIVTYADGPHTAGEIHADARLWCKNMSEIRIRKNGAAMAGTKTVHPSHFVSYLAHALGKDIRWAGRLLPFSATAGETMDSAEPGTFAGADAAVYVGFPSASYVRAFQNRTWTYDRIPDSAF